MPYNVLVAYATRYGSTAEVAEGIAEVMREHFGVRVDVAAVGEVRDISRYDTVLLGSAIIADRWLPEADDFLQRFEGPLNTQQVGYFITCMTIEKAPSASSRKITTYVADLHRHAIKPDVIGVFSGEIDADTLSEVEQYVTMVKQLPTGDRRDWSQIREWAIMAGDKLFGPIHD